MVDRATNTYHIRGSLANFHAASKTSLRAEWASVLPQVGGRETKYLTILWTQLQ